MAKVVMQVSLVDNKFYRMTAEQRIAELQRISDQHEQVMGDNQWTGELQGDNPFPEWVREVILRTGVDQKWDMENVCYLVTIETEPPLWARLSQWLCGADWNGDRAKVVSWMTREMERMIDRVKSPGEREQRRQWWLGHHIHCAFGFEQEADGLRETDEFYNGKGKDDGAAKSACEVS